MEWPALRQDLDLFPGPCLPDGQPTWTLHDPLRNLFFRIDWPTLEVLKRWSLADQHAIASAIESSTTLQPGPEGVMDVLHFMRQNQLIQPGIDQPARVLAERWQALQGGFWQKLLHGYLFFRVPLWRPDAWLTRWSGLASLLYSRSFGWLTLLALMLGLFAIARYRDTFSTTLVDTFSAGGLFAYGLAIIVVKFLHELGHAFTAKRLGCRVPTMGVAFLVMWPVAYTDSNDVWRLPSARQRLQIACAGIATELVLAAWASLAWALLPDGPLRTTAFVLATTSWIATLAINANPFMRFDGYFILSDWLDLPNLHGRSFALARWKLREWLFALGEDKPEHFSPQREALLIAFAWLTWVYRLVLFIGIAVLVYHFFAKVVGVVLFTIEIIWFVLQPLRHELLAWRARADAIKASPATLRSGLMACAGVMLLCLPWPGRVSASAVLRPAPVWAIHAPASGAQLIAMPNVEGSLVTKGSVVMRFEIPDLEARRRAQESRLTQARWQAETAGFNPDSRARLLQQRQTLATEIAGLSSLDAEAAEAAPVAPFTGRVRDLIPDLGPGQWLAKRERIAVLVSVDDRPQVETWLEERDAQRVRVGDSASFATDAGDTPPLALTVTSIEQDASRVVSVPALAVQHGGHLLTRQHNNELVPEHAIYRVRLEPARGTPAATRHFDLASRGRIVIHTRWASPGWRYLERALAVLIRETGF